MPLTSWTCDSCGAPIDDPALGLLVWREDEDEDDHHKAYDFLLVHKSIDGRSCDPGSGLGYDSSTEIDFCLGERGQSYLLSKLSLGPLKGKSDYRPGVKDFDEYIDVFRRLQTPWYEEARGRFNDEDVAHWLSDANEMYPYQPEVLERIAKRTLG